MDSILHIVETRIEHVNWIFSFNGSSSALSFSIHKRFFCWGNQPFEPTINSIEALSVENHHKNNDNNDDDDNDHMDGKFTAIV